MDLGISSTNNKNNCHPEVSPLRRPTAADASRRQLLGMKRKLSTEDAQFGSSSSPAQQQRPRTATTQHQQHRNPPKNDPAHLVKSEFESKGFDLKRASDASFLSYTKPTQQMIDSYKMETATAIRRHDLPKLEEIMRGESSDGGGPSAFNACNRFGESFIHMACRCGHVDTVKLLVERGNVSLLARDDFGRTPLHDSFWTSKPKYELVEYIISKFPELLVVPDVRGHLPLNYARREHWDGWFDFFSKRRELLRPKATSAPMPSSSSSATAMGGGDHDSVASN